VKKLFVSAAGLGYDLLSSNGMLEMAGMRFRCAESVFPAVTCVAQASLRTDLTPAQHGIVSNGYWSKDLEKPLFWEQSSRIVQGERIWKASRENGRKVGLYFFQQSLGEDVDAIVSPAPIHRHSGGIEMSLYTKPQGLDGVLKKLCGKFPLYRYWGPMASEKVGRNCISAFERMMEINQVDDAYLYLPTLDYALQKFGPESRQTYIALKEFRRQIEHIADFCSRQSVELKIAGDYAVSPVTKPPVLPNLLLRREGFFVVRKVKSMTYPDFFQSSAFAVCDHEFCVLYGPESERASKVLLDTGDYELPEGKDFSDTAGFTVLLAKKGSWCSYKWWTDKSEAPDYASHVDIHNKPGFDPEELFFFSSGAVKGTHGRRSLIAETEG
jgi:predicted AlkP superfamily pyrophosphatase or phosphodiesterase